MGLCREIYQEGFRIPPVKIVRGGKIESLTVTPPQRRQDVEVME